MVKKCAMAILAVSAVSMFVPTFVVYAQINSATDITEEEYLAVKNGPDGGVDRHHPGASPLLQPHRLQNWMEGRPVLTSALSPKAKPYQGPASR